MALLDENEIERLNEKLKQLELLTLPLIKVTYFKPDSRKEGGAYIQTEGRLKKIDSFDRYLVFEDKSSIAIESIFDIEIK